MLLINTLSRTWLGIFTQYNGGILFLPQLLRSVSTLLAMETCMMNIVSDDAATDRLVLKNHKLLRVDLSCLHMVE
jgi:hypothetical protein